MCSVAALPVPVATEDMSSATCFTGHVAGKSDELGARAESLGSIPGAVLELMKIIERDLHVKFSVWLLLDCVSWKLHLAT